MDAPPGTVTSIKTPGASLNRDPGMRAEFYPVHVLLAGLAGWLNRHQQDVIACLVEENRVLRGNRPTILSVTHIFLCDQHADFDVRQPGEPAPNDGVAGRAVVLPRQVAADLCELD